MKNQLFIKDEDLISFLQLVKIKKYKIDSFLNSDYENALILNFKQLYPKWADPKYYTGDEVWVNKIQLKNILETNRINFI